MDELIKSGMEKINWASGHMSVLNDITASYTASKPLAGLRLSMSIHLEAKTAYLALCLNELGASVACSGSNPLSTRDDICAALRSRGIAVNARYGETPEEYEAHLMDTLSIAPQVVLDDGGDLVSLLTGKAKMCARELIGGCEETTTGILRLKQLDGKGVLPFTMVDVNGAVMKHLFDNRYGTGQSVLDAIMRTTNLIIASKTVVVAGYGWCGRGVAMRASGMGAKVIITEVDPAKAVEAVMDGYEVMTMDYAALLGDIFITVTGCRDVITKKHFEAMKDGALLCNAGHFDVEVSVSGLEKLGQKFRVRDNISGYRLSNGKTLYLLGEGRLVNLAAGDGHPAEIMDLSFSLQLLSIKYLWEHRDELKPGLIAVPAEIDERVARIKLETLGVRIDELTPGQKLYLYGE